MWTRASTWGMRLMWFVALWAGGVAVTGLVAFGIRVWLAPH